MSKEPDWEAYDPQAAEEWHYWAEACIEELETANRFHIEQAARQDELLQKEHSKLKRKYDALVDEIKRLHSFAKYNADRRQSLHTMEPAGMADGYYERELRTILRGENDDE